MTEKPKRGRGRPPLDSENAGERFMVHLPEKIAEDLRAHGAGSLSRGIIRSHQGLPPIVTVKQARARKRARVKASADSGGAVDG